MRRASSPYRAPSPFSQHHHDSKFVQHQTLPTGPAQVGPGSITYTTSTGPDGRILYHPFKAVAASYQTPGGVVSGIQWVPAEPTSILPTGAQNVTAIGVADPASWHGSSYTGSHKDEYKDWQRAEEKRRKQEEKEAKRYRDQDGRNDSEYDMRMSRDRRKSISSGTPAPPVPVQFPTVGAVPMYPTHPSVAAGYPTNPYSNYGNLSQQPTGGPVYPSAYPGHTRSASASIPDVARQFKDMDLDRNKEHPERARKISGYGRPSESEHQHERARTTSANYSVLPDTYPYPPGSYASVIPFPPEKPVQTSPYPPASHYITPSPSMRSAEISSSGSASSTGYPGSNYSSPPSRNPSEPIKRSTTPFGGPPPQVYPRGHILEGQPILNSNQPRSRAPSRAPSPNPATKPASFVGKSPHMPVATIPGEVKQLPAPEAFSRPLNAANSFAQFDLTKIQNMDDIYDPKYPKMPPILSTHDIYPEDWKRCMQDLARCWSGQLPVPSSPNAPRRSTLARDLVDLWNHSFFFHRGVELILYKGREKRTGIHAGDPSVRLPSYDDADDLSSSSSSSTSSSLDSDDSDYAKRVTDAYGRPLAGQVDMQEARRRRLEAKQEKKRRRKEKKARRRAKARGKTYSVYVACLPRGPPAVPYGARPGAVQGGFGSGPAVPAGYIPSVYGQPVGMQVSRSHGYGSGY